LAAKLDPGAQGFAYVWWGIAGSTIVVDAAHSAYVTGSTLSPLLPTVNAYQPRNGGQGFARGREDAFLTKISDAPGPGPMVQEDGPAVAYTGTWYENRLAAHSGGRAALSAEKDATATFTFTGTGIQVYGYRDPWAGLALVSFDHDALPWGTASF